MYELKFMRAAIKEAMKAKEEDEVPVGAVLVFNGKIVARAHNKTERLQIATAHAEILAIDKACKKLKSWRLDGAEMYVTVEPCAMCAGAIVNARVKNVYFGAYEAKSGCAESKFPVLKESGLNHSTAFSGGMEEEICANIIKSYFKDKRMRKSLD